MELLMEPPFAGWVRSHLYRQTDRRMVGGRGDGAAVRKQWWTIKDSCDWLPAMCMWRVSMQSQEEDVGRMINGWTVCGSYSGRVPHQRRSLC